MAHKNEEQLKRLVERLNDPISSFFVHIDNKASVNSFRKSLKGWKNVHFIDCVRTDWGSFGLVEATINALKTIKHTGINYERISLLSGQDYPIKSNEDINNFFKTSSHTVFMEHYTLPNYGKWTSGGGMYRIDKYFLGIHPSKKFIAKTVNFLSIFLPLIKRKLPKPLKPFAGSQWWTIDMNALEYILKYIEDNPEYVAYHQFTFAPDELFFQTIIMNAADEKLIKSIKNDNLRYMKWESSSAAHPKTLLKKDINDISKSDALFARKFDASTDKEILEIIDHKFLYPAL